MIEIKYVRDKQKKYSVRKQVHKLHNAEPMLITSVDELIGQVSDLTGVSENAILGASRLKELVMIRYVVMWYLRHKFKYPFNRIGRILNRDHSTVIHALENVSMWERFPSQYYDANEIFNHIRNGCIFLGEKNTLSTVMAIKRAMRTLQAELEKLEQSETVN